MMLVEQFDGTWQTIHPAAFSDEQGNPPTGIMANLLHEPLHFSNIRTAHGCLSRDPA
jgi:hypothetical protein